MPKAYTTETFIVKAIQVHGDKYGYDRVVYKGWAKKVEIFCKKCNEYFFKDSGEHLRHRNGGGGCIKCSRKKTSDDYLISQEVFIDRIKKIYGNKYGYEKIIYTGMRNKVTLVCRVHGDIELLATNLIHGMSCVRCSNKKAAMRRSKKSKETFIDRVNKIHHDKYEYLSAYVSTRDVIKIRGKDCGHVFFQIANNHLKGNGCPICKTSTGEEKIRYLLLKNNITSISEKTFDDLLSKRNKKLRFDFYLPNLNTCIEYDGYQHFFPVDFTGRKTKEKLLVDFNTLKDNDKLKTLYCKEKGIPLIRISYVDFDNIENILIKKFNIKEINIFDSILSDRK